MVRPPAGGGVRLTRRGRVVLVVLAAVVLVTAFWLTAGRGANAGAPDRPAPGNGPRTVMVGDGDTLWEIAARTHPGRDPRETVRHIRNLNGISGSIVQPGQRLLVPR